MYGHLICITDPIAHQEAGLIIEEKNISHRRIKSDGTDHKNRDKSCGLEDEYKSFSQADKRQEF